MTADLILSMHLLRRDLEPMTYVLGLNAYHADAAACLVKDGDLVAAVEEERFRRIKHWAGFPSEVDPLLPAAKPASRWPTSTTSRSTATIAPTAGASSPMS